MYLEAVSVCVGYSDFLAEALQFNRPLFDRWLIVTAPQDEETRDLCHRHNLETLVTDDFYRGGTDFDKARAVDRGLQQLSHRDWVLHVDGDVVLPPHTRTTLAAADLDPQCLYGCDRVMVRGWERWARLKASGFLHAYSRSHHFNVCFPGTYDVGARWADLHAGYAPCGFFQLYHRDGAMRHGIRHRRYPAYGHSDAARTDMQFALQWDRRQRVLLPELVALHLESAGAAVGANWAGRTTPRFGPPAPQARPGRCY